MLSAESENSHPPDQQVRSAEMKMTRNLLGDASKQKTGICSLLKPTLFPLPESRLNHRKRDDIEMSDHVGINESSVSGLAARQKRQMQQHGSIS